MLDIQLSRLLPVSEYGIIYEELKENNLNQKGDFVMYALVFDTETTGLDKPFCYDLGYLILDMNSKCFVKQCHFVIEQIWHNLPLFESAYYKEKRVNYIKAMRAHTIVMDKWGYIMQSLYRDIKKYNITDAYAYNSDFDDKVFTFNCDWFKCNNPLETIAIHDIWGYASEYILDTDNYKLFCEQNQYFTDAGNYKGSAEIVYRYLTNDPSFIEAHMGLPDSQIEACILSNCVAMGANWATDYQVKKIVPRLISKPFVIKVDGNEVYRGTYVKKSVVFDTYNFKSGIKLGS